MDEVLCILSSGGIMISTPYRTQQAIAVNALLNVIDDNFCPVAQLEKEIEAEIERGDYISWEDFKKDMNTWKN